MLAIRMKRVGKRGHAQYRVIVQDSRFSPKSGRVTAFVGSYNPHTKAAVLQSEKISAYLTSGAQPSDRVARLLKKEGIKLPDWVEFAPQKKQTTRHPEKRRSTRPAGEPAPEPKTEGEAPADAEEAAPTETPETPAEPEAAEAPEVKAEEVPAAEEPAEEPASPEKPAEEPAEPEPAPEAEPPAEPAEEQPEKSAES